MCKHQRKLKIVQPFWMIKCFLSVWLIYVSYEKKQKQQQQQQQQQKQQQQQQPERFLIEQR